LLHPHVGGIILFSRNYQDRDQLYRLVEDIRSLRDPLLIAVDQEGGRVQRFKEGFTRLPALAELGQLYDIHPTSALERIQEVGYLMASELIAVGIDLSFAPVLDLNHGLSGVIGDRSFHRDPEVVVLLASAYIASMQKAGMKATGKHFPGHGGVVGDSHTSLPIDERTVECILQEDMLPFIALKDVLWGIMPAYVRYIQADQETAVFSSFWLQEILREEVGFQGAIISDDLSMAGAAPSGETYLQRAEKALTAGCDMLIVANNPSGVSEVLSGLSYEISANSQRRLMAGLKKNKV
jgi:beta-N-acetylhexosaminidase